MKRSRIVPMPIVVRRSSWLAFAMLATGCASAANEPADLQPSPVPVTATTPLLPAIPAVDGRLRLTVIYPPDSSRIAVRDSNFIFGSAGSGLARVSINGTPVQVSPNGAYLAFLPVPPDGVYRLVATKGADTARLVRTAILPPDPVAESRRTPIVPGSTYPRGTIALPYGDGFEVGFTGAAGGRASLVLPGGKRIALAETPILDTGTQEAGNFRTDAPPVRRASGVSRYTAFIAPDEEWSSRDTTMRRSRLAPDFSIQGLSAFAWGIDEDTSMLRDARERGLPVPTQRERDTLRRQLQQVIDANSAVADSIATWMRRYPHLVVRHARFELVRGRDTTYAPVDATFSLVAPATSRVGVVTAPAGAPADWTARGRASVSGPYHWFWPDGTRLDIDGERNGMYRVRLTESLRVWVPVSDIVIQPETASPARAGVTGVRMTPRPQAIDLRIVLDRRLPFRVDETATSIDVTIYGASSEVNFLQYGGLDPLVSNAAWSQPAEGEFHVKVDLTENVWGWDAGFDDSNALVVRIRRPPRIDPAHPLAGLLIAVDAGHPPGGGTGPTGLTEAEANLAVAFALKPLLEAAGARVLMLRTDAFPVDLGARPRLATQMNADVLVSLHNNAFPDGVDPFTNNGTSVYYFHPQSVDLARAIQRALLAELNLPDIGIGRADLAVPRASWMPSVLSETMFMMVPQQEAALRDPAVQRRIAQAHVRALEAFLRGRATGAR